MICKECDKELKGGFRQEDGTYLCGKCAIQDVNASSLCHTMRTLINKAVELETSKVDGRKYKEKLQETQKGLREMIHLMEFTLGYNDILKKVKQ